MCASVVAGVDAPPVLEPAEHVLDLACAFGDTRSCSIGFLQLDFEGTP
jgi:hypothetical protein